MGIDCQEEKKESRNASSSSAMQYYVFQVSLPFATSKI